MPKRRQNEYQGDILWDINKVREYLLKSNNSNVHKCVNNWLKGLPVPGSLKRQNKTYQFVTKADSDKRRILTNTQTGMTMPLQAIAYFGSLSLSLTYSLSATDGFLWVQGRAWPLHSNPQPHRRKSLLEHLLITTKSQTRARERSPGIRLCSNSKGLPNSPDKPLWNSTCSGCAMGSALPRTKTLH